jgi:hypothetical protein
MTLEEKIDELTSLIRAMDVKLKFLLDDSEEMKTRLTEINETVIQVATGVTQTQAKDSKSDRLAKFREETARW